jgi:hypothetical protein
MICIVSDTLVFYKSRYNNKYVVWSWIESNIYYTFKSFTMKLGYVHSFIQYSVWRQVQSLLQNGSST